jgi:hypothetical protein
MEIEKKYENLLGRPLTASELSNLNKIKDTLEVSDNDAFLTVLVALQYHLTLYQEIPEKINNAIQNMALPSLRSENIKPSAKGNYKNLYDSVIIIPIIVGLMIIFGSSCFYLGTKYNVNILNINIFNAIMNVPTGYITSILFFTSGIFAILRGTSIIIDGIKSGLYYILGGIISIIVSSVILFST